MKADYLGEKDPENKSAHVVKELANGMEVELPAVEEEKKEQTEEENKMKKMMARIRKLDT